MLASSSSDARRRDEDEEDEDEEDEDAAAREREPTAADLDAEARELLQWPELSAQVRAFTATTLGMRGCTPSLARVLRPTSSHFLFFFFFFVWGWGTTQAHHPDASVSHSTPCVRLFYLRRAL